MKKRIGLLVLMMFLMSLFTGIVLAEESQPLTVSGRIRKLFSEASEVYVGEQLEATPSVEGGVGLLWCDYRAEFLIGNQWLPWWVENRSEAERGSNHSYSLFAIESASKVRFYYKVYDEAGNEAEWLSPEVEVRKTIYDISTSEVTVGVKQTIAIRNEPDVYHYRVRVRDESIADARGNTIIDATIANNTYRSTSVGIIICGYKVGSTEVIAYDESGNVTKSIIVHVQKDPYYPSSDPNTPEGKIRGFVSRCYQLVLNREADEGGLTGWCDALQKKTAAAANIIDGFVKSDEFTNRKLSDDAKVDILYKTMLNREADAGGKAGWVDALSKGYTLQNIINGFCGSAEFKALCQDYGIEPGTVEASVPADASTPRGKIEAFVKRCYQLILNRQADDGGLKGWSDALEGKTAAAAQIIDGFVRSPEYINRSLTSDQSVTILYKTMLDREPDAAGKAGWVDALSKGYTLQNIINGFCGSAEFAAICAEYGIDAGSVNVAMSAAINAALTAKSLPDERIGNAVSADEAGQTTVIGYEPEEAEAFVKHAYREALGREADEAGLASWTEQILTGAVSPKAFLRTLLNSEEMKARNLSDEEFVTVMYRLYLKRVPDEAASVWIEILVAAGRDEVIRGFEGSTEFRVVLNGFGL